MPIDASPGPRPRAVDVRRAGAWEGPAATVVLDHDARFLRRKRLRTEEGQDFVADLPETVGLDDGDALVLESGGLIAVLAAEEPLLEVRGPALARLAWHIGNRHTPCQIEPDRLVIRDDKVLAEMLRGLGASVQPVVAPFRPEGGAYGHGRTLPHSHGHRHDPAAHAHHHLSSADIAGDAGD